MLKRYYSLDEGLQVLIRELEQPFTDADLLDLAKREEIDLCFYQAINMSTFEVDEVGLWAHVPRYPGGLIRGYFKVDAWELKSAVELPRSVNYIDVVEELDKPLEPRLRFEETSYMRMMPCTAFELEPGCVEWEVKRIELNRDQYLIKFSQLVALIQKHKETSGSVGSPTQFELPTKVRHTLLKIVLGMAIDSYRYDPSAKKNEATAQIVSDLAKYGISIDADTVRTYLKEAANTVAYEMPKH